MSSRHLFPIGKIKDKVFFDNEAYAFYNLKREYQLKKDICKHEGITS